jgi:hypothetical protein
MRPFRKAVYCETSVSTHWPGVHSMILVYGNSVVSVWNGCLSILPSSTAECKSEIGKSGLVTFVGFVNGGASRSTRALSGAVGRWARPAASICASLGCGMGIERDSVEHGLGSGVEAPTAPTDA